MSPPIIVIWTTTKAIPSASLQNIGVFILLEKVYGYDPIPKELKGEEENYILGAQGNVWTEYIKTPDYLEYMVFPRLLALSEVVWSPVEDKD